MKRDRIPEDILKEILYRTIELNLEFADNFRAYRVRDGYLRDEFVKAVARGCCGVYEHGTTYQGDKWVIGCNYGH